MSQTTNSTNTAWSFKYEIPWCPACQDWHGYSQAHTRPPFDPGASRRRHQPPPNQPPSADAKLQAALRILGLETGASRGDIRAAYREKMKTTHPDRGGDLEEAKRVNAAMDELRRRGLA